jgi:hypothetical protein
LQKVKEIITRFPVLSIVLVFLFAELIVNPIGNFPLNDDWWYAYAYRKLFEESGSDKFPWGATSLVGQLILTKSYAFFAGCSYTALRLFTLILSFLCITFIFKILTRRLKVDATSAFVLCVIFLFSPLYLSLSNSYMSDVPFLFFLSGGFYFYLIYKESRSFFHLLVCIVFFTFSILTRQLTIAFLIAIVVADLITRRKVSMVSLAVLFVPGVVLFFFELWIQTKITNPIYTYVFFRNLPILNKIGPFDIFINLCKRWIHFINYSGFVLFPILIPYLLHYLKTVSYRVISKDFLIALVLSVPVFISMNKFPLGNYLYNFGIGPDTLYDFFTPQYGATLNAPILFLFMKALAYVSSFALLLVFVNFVFSTFPDLKKETLAANSNSILFISCLCFYYGAMCCTCAIFDRYIVPFTFFAVLLLHKQFIPLFSKNYSLYVSLSLLILFSTLGTKDYLNSNRVRWEVVRILKEEFQASDKDINAGYEHEGSCFPETEDWYPKWTNTTPNLYMVTRQNFKNYIKLGFYAYQQYMPWRKDTLFYSKLDTITRK